MNSLKLVWGPENYARLEIARMENAAPNCRIENAGLENARTDIGYGKTIKPEQPTYLNSRR